MTEFQLAHRNVVGEPFLSAISLWSSQLLVANLSWVN